MKAVGNKSEVVFDSLAIGVGVNENYAKDPKDQIKNQSPGYIRSSLLSSRHSVYFLIVSPDAILHILPPFCPFANSFNIVELLDSLRKTWYSLPTPPPKAYSPLRKQHIYALCFQSTRRSTKSSPVYSIRKLLSVQFLIYTLR